MDNKFLNLIKGAERILITSHFSPDADAVCSVLLLSSTLKKNFPGKNILPALEEKPSIELDFLEGYGTISFGALNKTFSSFNPDLLIILDANSVKRISRDLSDNISDFVNENKTKKIIIDHHELAGRDESDLYINNKSPAVTQDIYELCFYSLKLDKPRGYGKTAMLGIISDTFRFKYFNPRHRATFNIVSELMDDGINIEELENKLERYTTGQMKVLSHLAGNVIADAQGFNYSFVSDEFSEAWAKDKKNIASYKSGCELFSNQYVRNIDRNYWGFIVYRELTSLEKTYSVSFRAISGSNGFDVAKLASRLGGGGHRPAAGAKLKASSIEDVIQQVKSVINNID